MSKVEFEEFQTQSYTDFDDAPKIVNWVINYSGGLVKDTRQAQYVLLGFVVVILSMSLVMILNSGDNYRNVSSTDTDFVPAEI